MPKCINDSSSSFTGAEPSPKGLGYCAHAEKAGTKMKGKNGKMWIVKLVANKSKRWMLFKDLSSVASSELKGCKFYFTQDNGGNPFMICIQGKKVSVYKINEKMENNGEIPDEFYRAKTKELKKFAYLYSKKVCSYKPLKVFIGKSPLTELTKSSKGFGSSFDGNSVLLQINKLNYVFIGDSIFEFKAYAEITQFLSPVGPSSVSYPFAVDKLGNYYLMVDKSVMELKDKNIKLKKEDDPYTIYYGYSKKQKIEFMKKTMMNQKLIHKRIW
jgi:hypothetical protein